MKLISSAKSELNNNLGIMYFLHYPSANAVKIGISEKPLERCESLSKACKQPTVILNTVVANTRIEHALHNILITNRKFIPVDDIRLYSDYFYLNRVKNIGLTEWYHFDKINPYLDIIYREINKVNKKLPKTTSLFEYTSYFINHIPHYYNDYLGLFG